MQFRFASLVLFVTSLVYQAAATGSAAEQGEYCPSTWPVVTRSGGEKTTAPVLVKGADVA